MLEIPLEELLETLILNVRPRPAARLGNYSLVLIKFLNGLCSFYCAVGWR